MYYYNISIIYKKRMNVNDGLVYLLFKVILSMITTDRIGQFRAANNFLHIIRIKRTCNIRYYIYDIKNMYNTCYV